MNNSPYLKDDSYLESTNIISVKFVRERTDDPNKEKIKVNYKTTDKLINKGLNSILKGLFK